MKIVYTEGGQAVLLNPHLTELKWPFTPMKGHIALGILLSGRTGKPDCFCLFWEWGGNWMIFGDEQHSYPDELAGWEPAALREAVAAAIGTVPECAEDLEWFLDWAAAAEETLKQKAP